MTLTTALRKGFTMKQHPNTAAFHGNPDLIGHRTGRYIRELAGVSGLCS
jgi:hypothetical protein